LNCIKYHFDHLWIGIVQPPPPELTLLVKELHEMGLAGLEVFYPGHTKEMVVLYQDIAKKLGLVCTGGSDFHGNLRDHSYLGNGILGQDLDYGLLQNIRNRLPGRENRHVQS